MPSSDGNHFGKRWRIRRRKDYLAVQSRGSRVHSTYFLLLLLPNGRSHTRLGITVSRKVGKAVVRNRVRRYVREVFRQNKEWFVAGWDVVVIAKRRAAEAAFSDVSSDLGAASGRVRRRTREQPLRASSSAPSCC